MTTIRMLTQLVLIFTLSMAFSQPLHKGEKYVSFDKVKGQLALHESANGKYKVNANSNRTIDCGLYQINSIHFIPSRKKGEDEVYRSFSEIFTRHGIGTSLHERVVAAIMDDALNEELARTLYNLRGIDQWTSSAKFIKKVVPEEKAKVVKAKVNSQSKNTLTSR